MEDMPKNYDPQQVEPELIDAWMSVGAYRRREGVGDCTVVIPPPNVTGMLHMGHALDDTIQDAIVRRARMQGRSTRWVLGTDHAGIATQTKVDKRLKEQGVSRLEMGREKFVEACWDWTREYGGIILDQIRRMGCSVDFDDPKFTMDPHYAHAVRKVFCDWYHDDLIYRGKRIVNWCPVCDTAISDDEAEYRDEDGFLWYLRYPLTEPVDGREYVVVATTRPETMLGDTGVAVSPKDEEKAKFVGKTVDLPIVGRQIPIFADYHVDAGFGTGFVKVTPAHDPNDYVMGQAHGLEQVNIFDEHAVVVDGYGEFSGMDRDQARKAVVEWFESRGLLDRVEPLRHSVMHCYRCGTALEPWLSEQWFVAVDRLKGPATEAVVQDAVQFHPQRWTQTYLTWMENLKDWCISRQLWWGHRIPVFYCDDCGWEDASEQDVHTCPQCGSAHVRQDENVLDTWFSSQLWTFATQGWPDDPAQMAGHHPTAALVTARDIIALWVARMVMSSLYFVGEVPFHDVVIYPTILAKDGSRMSKSKGNGVDPMELMAKYGADAMRFNLMTLVTTNQDVKFDANIDKKTHRLVDSPRTEQAKSFVTKIWNAARFVLTNMDGYEPGPAEPVTDADRWIFSRLAKLTAQVDGDMDQYLFGNMARSLYTFFWNEFCDWYIEYCKPALYAAKEGEPTQEQLAARLQTQRNLVFVLDTALRLLHPTMPFVTEYIWQNLPFTDEQRTCVTADGPDKPLLMLSAWPDAASLQRFVDEKAEHAFDLVVAVVGYARSTRAHYAISPRQQLRIVVDAQPEDVELLEEARGQVCEMGRLSELAVAAGEQKPAGAVSSVAQGMRMFVDLSGLVDLDKELARSKKQLEKAEQELAGVLKVLSNPGFLARAAQDVVAEKRARQEELSASVELLRAQVEDLS